MMEAMTRLRSKKNHFTDQTSLRRPYHATDESNEKLRGRDDLDASTTTKITNQPSALIANSPMDESNDKTRVREILQKAGVEITPEVESIIPTWSEVTSLYGSKPKIIGLETCATFRNSVTVSAMIGPSGIFNTGTNLLSSLLSNHCTIPNRKKGSKQRGGWGCYGRYHGESTTP